MNPMKIEKKDRKDILLQSSPDHSSVHSHVPSAVQVPWPLQVVASSHSGGTGAWYWNIYKIDYIGINNSRDRSKKEQI